MYKFPNEYKAKLLTHGEEILDVARELARRNPDLNIHTACAVICQANLDASVALIFNSISAVKVSNASSRR